MDYFEDKKLIFEKALEKFCENQTTLVREAMAYSLLAGGKRLRPVLFLGVLALYRDDWQKFLGFGLGLEMIHTYSLIHDDLPAMDNDDFRRGKPTNHRIYGEAMAILAGDGLLTESFRQMANCHCENPENLLRAIAKAGSYAGARGMIYGQSLDILAENKRIPVDKLKEIHFHKTGALIALSLVCGAILGGADEEEIGKWEEFGRNLGLGFQITDDILDEEGTFEDLGKPIGSDEASHKNTYVSLLGIDVAKSEAKKVINKANESISSISKDTAAFQKYATQLLTRKV
ncbi:MAG: polyprenyl synthetase family protein [Clostridiales bacterium]